MASAQEQLHRPDHSDHVSHHKEEDEKIAVDGHDQFVPDAAAGYNSTQTNPASSFTTSKSLKDEDDKAKNDARRDAMHKLKSSILVSGATVAVIGAIFAVAKKIKEA